MQRDPEGILGTWKPIFKGIYRIYINDIKISTSHKIVILSADVNADNSTMEIQDLSNLYFFDVTKAVFVLRDSFGNAFSEVEQVKYYSEKELISARIVSEMSSKLKYNCRPISKNGKVQVDFWFESENIEENYCDGLVLTFLLGGKEKSVLQVSLNGISLEKRRQAFIKEMDSKFRPKTQEIVIRRMNFFEDLVKLLEKDQLRANFSVKFSDEQGIDAGGLKREFYDMIGQTMKDDKYLLFRNVPANPNKYFLHPKANSLKEKNKYFKLFGALVANSIANQQLIGVDFAPPLFKMLYGDPIDFPDLSHIVDQQTYDNLNSLRNMTHAELLTLDMDFTKSNGNKVHKLIDDGENVKVTKDNLEEYLRLSAEYEI